MCALVRCSARSLGTAPPRRSSPHSSRCPRPSIRSPNGESDTRCPPSGPSMPLDTSLKGTASSRSASCHRPPRDPPPRVRWLPEPLLPAGRVVELAVPQTPTGYRVEVQRFGCSSLLMPAASRPPRDGRPVNRTDARGPSSPARATAWPSQRRVADPQAERALAGRTVQTADAEVSGRERPCRQARTRQFVLGHRSYR